MRTPNDDKPLDANIPRAEGTYPGLRVTVNQILVAVLVGLVGVMGGVMLWEAGQARAAASTAQAAMVSLGISVNRHYEEDGMRDATHAEQLKITVSRLDRLERKIDRISYAVGVPKKDDGGG